MKLKKDEFKGICVKTFKDLKKFECGKRRNKEWFLYSH